MNHNWKSNNTDDARRREQSPGGDPAGLKQGKLAKNPEGQLTLAQPGPGRDTQALATAAGQKSSGGAHQGITHGNAGETWPNS